MERVREIIKNKLKEISATNQGGASFSSNAGQGAQYATPKAFNKNTNSKGAKNIYYYKLGFKPVPKIKPKSYDIKKLFETEKLNELNDVQKRRLNSLDEIERMLKELNPLISNMKNDTIELYSGNAGSYDINEPIEIVLSYLKDIKKLLTDK
jgi:hypothetical protein